MVLLSSLLTFHLTQGEATIGLAVLAVLISAYSAAVARGVAVDQRRRAVPDLHFAASVIVRRGGPTEDRALDVSVTNVGFRPVKVRTGGFVYADGTFESGELPPLPALLTDGESLSLRLEGQHLPETVWVQDATGRHYTARVSEVLSAVNAGPLSPFASALAIGMVQDQDRESKKRRSRG